MNRYFLSTYNTRVRAGISFVSATKHGIKMRCYAKELQTSDGNNGGRDWGARV